MLSVRPKFVSLVVPVVVLALSTSLNAQCGPGNHWVDSCAAGNDTILGTQLFITIDTSGTGCVGDMSATLTGPAMVTRSGPMDASACGGTTDGHLDVIETEMVDMVLTGGGITLTVGSANGLPPSNGCIIETAGNSQLATSFFDMIFKVDLGGGVVGYSQQTYRMQTTIDRVPPNGTYIKLDSCIQLWSSPTPGQGTPIAVVVVANHQVGGGPGPGPEPGGNGTNFHIFSNQMDAIYAGLGAGGTSVDGVDGLGLHLNGEDIRGNTLTALGDFGYSQSGFRESMCVLGAPSPSLVIDFPLLVMIEFDGVGVFGPASVFTFPACAGASFPLGNSGGFAPYGGPPGGSFVLLGLPSGLGLPSSTAILAPNEGLVGGPTTATATLIAWASASLPIASTGFCWVVQFGWLPSALTSLDDIDSWYTWRSSGRGGAFGEQYWSMSNDELGTWQSQTLATANGLGLVLQFSANLNYEYHSISINPTIHDALAPTGFNGAGTYYTMGAGVPNSGSSLNGGFDVGMHQGMSLNGTGGVPNPNTGVSNQDPAGSPTAGLVPSLGFFSYNNSPSGGVPQGGTFRLTWISIYNELSFGFDPATNSDATLAFGTARTPNSISQIPGPFPQPTTLAFFPFFIHATVDQATVGNVWPDPSGLGGGSFGVQENLGASSHLPTLGLTGTCIGLPLGLQYGSSSLGSAGGPLQWAQSGPDAPSNSGVIPLIN